MKNRKLVVVLGMHRSGTSALTRGLRVLQVELGDHLIPGQEGRNDKGYWEDADINAFNERLLARLGSSWHGLTHLDKVKFSAPELDDMRAEARTLLEEKLAGHERFGFKDPRTAILLPFWQPIFAQLKLDDTYLIALRNPLDVAASLLKRDAIPLTESFLLWAKYTIAALHYSKGKRRLLVQYDALLETPGEQLKRIAECLHLPLQGQTRELQKYTGEFLSKDLRHSKSSQAAINRSPEAPIFVRQAYDRLRKAAKLQLELDSSAFTRVWADIERDYLKAVPLYSHIDLLNASNTASRRAFQQSEMESEDLRKELPKAYSLAEHASRELEQALIERGHMGAQKDRAEQDRDRAEQERDRADQEKARAERERSDAIQELDRIQGELKGVSAERDTILNTLDAAIAEREQALMRVEESAAERGRVEQERDRAEQERDRAEQERDRVVQEKARAERERSDAIQKLGRIQGEIKSVSAERDTFLTTLDAAIAEREQALMRVEESAAERDRAEQERNRAEQERNRADQEKARAERERSEAIQELGRIQGELKGVSAERDTFLSTLDAAIVEREQAMIRMEESAAERDRAVQERDRAEQERDRADQEKARAERERSDATQELGRYRGELKGVSAERDTVLTKLDAAIAEREQALMQVEEAMRCQQQLHQEGLGLREQLAQEVTSRQQLEIELNRLLSSKSWKLTSPLRAIRRIFFTSPYGLLRKSLSYSIRAIWHGLPGDPLSKSHLKGRLFRVLPTFLGWTQAYRDWVIFVSQQPSAGGVMPDSDEIVEMAPAECHTSTPYLESPESQQPSAVGVMPDSDEIVEMAAAECHPSAPYPESPESRQPSAVGVMPDSDEIVEMAAAECHASAPYPESPESRQSSAGGVMPDSDEIVEMAAAECHESAPHLESPRRLARLIAFYLPQFHPIPENDLWWGDGFTEWTNTAKARPLFTGHEIPSVPSDLGYYDLRVPDSRQAQAELAREYGIEGFCYWHYWFGNGRQLLERPFNEVLASGNPDFPFCLAWANHTWSGVWHGCPDRVLIEQTYPGIEDIKMHFYSLLDAFEDERYIKIDGRNIFCIYRPTDIVDATLFFDTWRELAEKEGAPGFYFIAITDYPWNRPQDGYDAYTTNPPVGMLPYQGIESMNEEIEKEMLPGEAGSQLPQIYSYETFVENAFPEATRRMDFYPCVVPNWDNTPRSGSDGFALHGSTPQLFGRHLGEAVALVEDRDPDQRVIFVKSWNEWAETNYLEPDVKWGRDYLSKTLEIIENKERNIG